MENGSRTDPRRKKRLVSVKIRLRPNRFNSWRKEFYDQISRTSSHNAWKNLVQAGCVTRDLEWVLYNAIDSLDSALDAFKQGKMFRRQRNSVISEVRRLRKDFSQLTSLQLLGEPAYRVILAALTFEQVPPVFGSFDAILAQFERLLTLMDPVVGSGNVKRSRSAIVCGGEALVHLYIEEFTNRGFPEDTSGLLEYAAAAYGLDGERSFSTEAVNRRYKRYLRDHPLSYAHRQSWIREFKCLRQKIPDTNLELFIVRKSLEEGYSPLVEFWLKKSRR
jgi:hypothetical protein